MSQSPSYEEMLSQLVEIEDPPLPDVANPLEKMSSSEARKHTVTLLVTALVLGLAATALWYFDVTFWAWVAGILALLLAIVSFAPKGLVARCPFCSGQLIGLVESMEGDEIECTRCHEYSVLREKKVRPLDPETKADSPRFKSPLFKDARWPKACVACGDQPTRLEEISGSTVGAAHLVVGRVAVARGKVSGVPYCSDHKDAVKIKVNQDRTLELRWSYLRMMRRYLAANRSLRR